MSSNRTAARPFTAALALAMADEGTRLATPSESALEVATHAAGAIALDKPVAAVTPPSKAERRMRKRQAKLEAKNRQGVDAQLDRARLADQRALTIAAPNSHARRRAAERARAGRAVIRQVKRAAGG